MTGDATTSPEDTETTIAVLSSTSDGNFAGAVMPMAQLLDTRSQWQHLIDGLLSAVILEDPEANIDGVYAFNWWSEESLVEKTESSGLILTRISDEPQDLDPSILGTLENLLGLMVVTQENDTQTRTAILGLRGYSTAKGKLRPDRVFATMIDQQGKKVPGKMDPAVRRSLNLLGRDLIQLIDNHSQINTPGRAEGQQ